MIRFLLFLLFCFNFSVSYGDELCIKSVTLQHLEAWKFERIREYFTGCEDCGGDTIFRLDEGERGGLYLVLGLNRAVRELGEKMELVFRYVECGQVKEKEVRWEIDPCRGGGEYVYIGLTGCRWLKREKDLKGWSVEIRDEGGELVARRASFLWEKRGK